MNPTSMNNCPYNEPVRYQCILRNENDNCDHYLLLTQDQIRMVKYLLFEEVLDPVNFALIVLDEEGRAFEKV